MNVSQDPSERDLRRNERGQVTVLFILILITSILVAIVAVSIGQVFVRRQRAQHNRSQ